MATATQLWDEVGITDVATGAVVKAWLASRFVVGGILVPPAYDSPLPSGAPDAGPVTIGSGYGNPGAFQLTLPDVTADYYLSAEFNGHISWRFRPGQVAVTIVGGAPSASAPGDTSSNGTGTAAAAVDHRHAREGFGAPGNSAPGDAANPGTGTSVARSTHTHGREAWGVTADIQPVGHSNAAGASGHAADAAHTHAGVHSIIAGANVTVTDDGAGNITVASTGGGGGGSEAFQHNGTAVASQGTLDFEDTASVTFTVTNDAANSRVKVSAAASGTGLPAAPSVDSRLYIPASGSAIWVPESNEEAAARLVNATSAGDAGGRADHFEGSALGAAWTREGTAPTLTVAKSVMSVAPAGGAECGFWTPYTPSGAFRVEARAMLTSHNNQLVFAVKDSSSGSTASGNWFCVAFNIGSTTQFYITTVDAGSETVRAQLSFGAQLMPGRWIYLAIARDASNNFTGYCSFNRVGWLTIGTWTKTLTVAKLGRRDVGSGLVTDFDFIDVVS